MAPIFALTLVPVLGFVALSIDVGGWTHQKSNLSSAADAGSLAGASELVRALQEGDQNGAAGRADAVALKFVRANDPAVEKYRIESSSITPIQVVVDLNESGKQSFSQIINPSAPIISAYSLAMVVEAADACVVALEPTASPGIEFGLSGEVAANGCSIWSNATTSSLIGKGSGKVSADTICAVGTTSVSTSLLMDPKARPNCISVKDPLAHWNPPSYSTTCLANNLVLDKPGNYSLRPGLYCGGITIKGGAKVRLEPGLFIVKNGPFAVEGGGSVTGVDVSILLTGAGAVANLGGASVVDLSAPTTGEMAGMLFASGRNEPQQSSIFRGSNTFRLDGHIYLPTHDLRYSGGPEGYTPATYTTVIARTVKFDGSSRVTFRKNSGSGPSHAAKAFSHIVLSR